MVELKTKLTKKSAAAFIKSVADEQRRKDGLALLKIFQDATGEKAEMWGESIVGFGRRTYTYANGKEGEWMQVGFSPRKQNLALYGLKVFTMTAGGLKETKGQNDFLLKLGKYKEGGGCLYVNKLSDIDTKELAKIIKLAVRRTTKKS